MSNIKSGRQKLDSSYDKVVNDKADELSHLLPPAIITLCWHCANRARGRAGCVSPRISGIHRFLDSQGVLGGRSWTKVRIAALGCVDATSHARAMTCVLGAVDGRGGSILGGGAHGRRGACVGSR
jgi:hypothetical protein